MKERLRMFVEKLAEARRRLDVAQSSLSYKREALEARFQHENAGLLEEEAAARVEVLELEAHVKEMALQVAEEKGTTTPAPGVKIKRVRALEYDEGEAIKWVVEIHRKSPQALLSIKKRPFEKLMRALEESDLTPEFVAVKEERQVALARDLEKALEEAGNA